MHSSIQKLVVGIILLVAVVLFKELGLDWDAARWIISYTGYYFCFILSALFLYYGWKLYGAALFSRGLWRSHGFYLLLCGVIAFFVQLHEPFMMRVYYDEPSHMSVSMMMHEERLAVNPSKAHYQFGNLIFLDINPGFRSIYYSFLVSIIHDVSGYRVANGHVANVLITLALFAMVYALGVRFKSRVLGLLGVLLLASLPLLAASMTSIGYDMTNLLFLSIFLWVGLDYAQRGGESRFTFFVLVGLLLALSRNESVLYLATIPVVVLTRWIRMKQLELSWLSICSPVVLLLPFSFKTILDHTPMAIPEDLREQGIGFFAWQYIPENLAYAVHFFFSFDNTNSNSWLLSVVGSVALLFFLVRYLKEFLTGKLFVDLEKLFCFCYLAISIGIFLLFMSHFWKITDSQAIRLLLPIQLAAVWAVFVCVRELSLSDKLLRVGVAVSAFFFFVFTLSTNAKGFLTNQSVISTYHEFYYDYLAEHDDGDTLYVTQSTLSSLVYKVPTISIAHALMDPEKLMKCVKEGLYKQVVFFEVLEVHADSYELTGPRPSLPLPENLIYETIMTKRLFHNQIARLSVLAGMKDEEGREISIEEYEYVRPLMESEADLLGYMGSLVP